MSEPGRSSPGTSWLAGLVLGVMDGVLLLEFPIAGIGIALATIGVIGWKGRLVAGLGGALTGVGATWLVLFGRVALTCGADVGDAGCFAPGIGSAVTASAGVLAVGLAISAFAAVRSRRA